MKLDRSKVSFLIRTSGKVNFMVKLARPNESTLLWSSKKRKNLSSFMNCFAFNSNLVTVWWYLIGTTYSFRGASPIISFQTKLRFILLDSQAGCENVNWGKQIFADPFWKLLKEPTLPEKKLRQNPEKLITQMVNITCTKTQNSWWVIKRCEFDLKETFQRQWQRSGRSGRWERQLSMGGEDGGRGTRTWKWESESKNESCQWVEKPYRTFANGL